MVIRSASLQERESLFTFHFLQALVLTGIALFAFFSGMILPYAAIKESIQEVGVLSKATSLQKILPSQVAYEEVTPKKAPRSVLTATSANGNQWGVSKQIGEHTWTMKVQDDTKTGTAQEIFQALNAYRQRHGSGTLAWDSKLGDFAQGRADAFTRNNSTDAHAGFSDFINNQDGFHKLGFMALGENSSFGYHVEAVHLIEWIYAGDAPHNDNQLNQQWTHVGIGVSGVATDLIFGGKKM
ncbi:MAG: CAP domain-containing protein [Candidatus Levybacteria bacterium]|nr:CAP domain-containing protein [Candidatus Levybacteria bacterium]